MNHVGVDLHKETSLFYIVDKNGKKISSKNVTNNPEVLKQYFEQIPMPFILAVEATYNWYYFVDIAEQYAEKVFLANSYELKAFAKRHKKTDKIDARLIATILQKGFLPVVTIADKQTRQVRELLRYRMKLVTDRSRNISRLKALLDRLGINSNGDFTTYKRLKAISAKNTTTIYKKLVINYIGRITELTQKLKNIEKDISTPDAETPEFRKIMTPELYFGYNFYRDQLGNPEGISPEETTSYTIPENFIRNYFYLDGSWNSKADYMELQSDGLVHLTYNAKSVNIVAGSEEPVEIIVYLDNKEYKTITVQNHDLYNIVSTQDYGEHELEIKGSKGLRMYTFTFG